MIRIYRPVIKLPTERFSVKCSNSSSLEAPNNSSKGPRVSLYNRKRWKILLAFNSNNSKWRNCLLAMHFQSQNQQSLPISICLTRVQPRISSVHLRDKCVEWLAAQAKAWLSNCCMTRMMALSLHTALVRIPEESLQSTNACQSETWQTIIASQKLLTITNSNSRGIWRPLIR